MQRQYRAEGDPLVVAEPGRVEVHHQHLRRGGRAGQQRVLQLLHRGDQPIHPERRPHPGQHLLRVLAREVVVPPAAAHAPDARQVGQEGLVNGPGVVVEPARDAEVDLDAPVRHARLRRHREQLAKVANAGRGPLVRAREPGFQVVQELIVRAGDVGHQQHAGRLLRGHLRLLHHLLDHLLATDLRQLVERPQHRHRLVRDAERFQQPVQDQPVVDPNLKAVEADRGEQVVDDQRGLDVGGVGRGADGVVVALPELAVPALPRSLAAPHRAHRVPLERRPQLVDVLRAKPRERHSQVEPQPHLRLVAARAQHAVHELVGLVAALAEQHVERFHGRGVDRREPVGPADGADALQDALPRDHRGGEVVTEAR